MAKCWAERRAREDLQTKRNSFVKRFKPILRSERKVFISQNDMEIEELQRPIQEDERIEDVESLCNKKGELLGTREKTRDLLSTRREGDTGTLQLRILLDIITPVSSV